MESPIFSIYIGQTEAVTAELEFFHNEEIEIADAAIFEIADIAARDAKKKKLRKQYAVTLEHVTVSATARLSGKKIYVVIVHVGTDGDWDPNGGKGLDHIAYSRIHEIAKAFVTFIDERPNFRWMQQKLLQLNNIDRSTTSLDIESKEALDSTDFERVKLDIFLHLDLPLNIWRVGIQRFPDIQSHKLQPRGCRTDLALLPHRLMNEFPAHIPETLQPSELSDTCGLPPRWEAARKIANAHSSRPALCEITLPPGWNSFAHNWDFLFQHKISIGYLDPREPPMT